MGSENLLDVGEDASVDGGGAGFGDAADLGLGLGLGLGLLRLEWGLWIKVERTG